MSSFEYLEWKQQNLWMNGLVNNGATDNIIQGNEYE